jgi:ABC-type microcin C transport system permease subunit YejE
MTKSEDFSRQAEQTSPSLLGELVDFLLHNKAWWITPIVVVLLLVGLLIFLAGTGAAPFIYPLF